MLQSIQNIIYSHNPNMIYVKRVLKAYMYYLAVSFVWTIAYAIKSSHINLSILEKKQIVSQIFFHTFLARPVLSTVSGAAAAMACKFIYFGVSEGSKNLPDAPSLSLPNYAIISYPVNIIFTAFGVNPQDPKQTLSYLANFFSIILRIGIMWYTSASQVDLFKNILIKRSWDNFPYIMIEYFKSMSYFYMSSFPLIMKQNYNNTDVIDTLIKGAVCNITSFATQSLMLGITAFTLDKINMSSALKLGVSVWINVFIDCLIYYSDAVDIILG